MMKRFDHDNIVKLLGVCTRGEPAYTIMEFMLHGKKLKHFTIYFVMLRFIVEIQTLLISLSIKD